MLLITAMLLRAVVQRARATVASRCDIQPPPTPHRTSTRSSDGNACGRPWSSWCEAATRCSACLLEGASPTAVSERELVVSFPPEADFYKRKAEQDDYRRATAEAVRNVTGIDADAALRAGGGADRRAEEAEPRWTAEPMSDEELVQRFVEEFGAEEILQDDQKQES